MWHSATTAFRGKRAGEKSTENTLEILPEIGETSDEKSRRVPDAGRKRFWFHVGPVFGRFCPPEFEKIRKMTDPGAVRKNVSF